MKVFVFDAEKCNGCMNCRLACKDEHCDNDWAPYARTQPQTGQFWCDVEEKVRGTVPKVKVAYIAKFGAQDEAIRDYAPEALQQRDDRLIVLDPEKTAGRRDIAERFDGVYYNEELDCCQGCTGCAHLLDDGWTVPRCVEACGLGALRFGDAEDFGNELKDAVQLTPGSHVYYLNYPKRFIAGEVVDPDADEVVIGASVTMENAATGELERVQTDELGDFWFNQIEPGDYRLYFEKDGYLTRMIDASCADEDANVGTVELFAAEV